jgi:hypothetical protein
VPGYFTSAGLVVLSTGEERLLTTEFRQDGPDRSPVWWLVAGLTA